jgi:hypothetical protein
MEDLLLVLGIEELAAYIAKPAQLRRRNGFVLGLLFWKWRERRELRHRPHLGRADRNVRYEQTADHYQMLRRVRVSNADTASETRGGGLFAACRDHSSHGLEQRLHSDGLH